jgi:glucose-1-phosphate adenylyltransferase
MNKPLVMLLAGGGGTRLGVLVKRRSKPAVPFGGSYRIIDMALSNVMHAGLDWVGVLTQYKPLSLMSHIGTGEPWNFLGHRRGVRILPPRTGQAASDWYRGTADAVWRSMDFMAPLKPERVLILSGDHIYRMDYQQMLDNHIQASADVSIAVMPVSPKDSSRFGMIWTDNRSNITRFEEKPAQADTDLASMGIYMFEWDCLVEALQDIVGGGRGNDFGQHIMPALLGSKRLVAHRFSGYWRDVGTVSSFFDASMDTLNPKSGLDLMNWEICSREDTQLPGDRPPTRFGSGVSLSHVRVSAGCQIDGTVRRSVISPEVVVAKDALVEDAILMNGVVVGKGAQVRRAIIDKDVRIGAGTQIDGRDESVINPKYAKCDLNGIVLVGKGTIVPENLSVGSSVVIQAGLDEKSFSSDVSAGTSMESTTS